MAKKSLIIRNTKREKLSIIHRKKRELLKQNSLNTKLSFQERIQSQIKLSEMSKDGSKTRYRNRCSLTGRPRGNLRRFGISRIALRELASWGQIPGLIKSSW